MEAWFLSSAADNDHETNGVVGFFHVFGIGCFGDAQDVVVVFLVSFIRRAK